MNDLNLPNKEFDPIIELDQELTKLLESHEQLLEENRLLRREHQTLASENAALNDKNRQVKTRIETLLGRLKALEKT